MLNTDSSYILWHKHQENVNRVPSKSVSTTPFEVLYGRMPSFGHIFGDARQRLGSIIQKKESWTRGLNHVISLVILRNLKGSSSIMHRLILESKKLTMLDFSRTKMFHTLLLRTSFLKKLNSNNLKNFPLIIV